MIEGAVRLGVAMLVRQQIIDEAVRNTVVVIERYGWRADGKPIRIIGPWSAADIRAEFARLASQRDRA